MLGEENSQVQEGGYSPPPAKCDQLRMESEPKFNMVLCEIIDKMCSFKNCIKSQAFENLLKVFLVENGAFIGNSVKYLVFANTFV